jgi:hypothetical protein
MTQLVLALSLSLAALLGQFTVGSRSFYSGTPAISVVETICVSHAASYYPCSDGGSGTSFAATFGTPTTAGEIIIMPVWSGSGGTSSGSVLDSGSSSLTQDPVVRITGSLAHYDSTIFYECNVPSGVTGVTWTFGSGDTANFSWMAVAHAKVSGSSSCADVAANYGSYVSSPFTSASTPTTNYANELLMGIVNYYSNTTITFSPTGGWIMGIQGQDREGISHAIFLQTVNATGSYAVTGTGTGVNASYISAIRTVH